MDNELLIREAGEEEINTIGFLAQQIWPEAYKDILNPAQLKYMMDLFYSPASLKEQIRKKAHKFLLTELEEEPVGFASYSPSDSIQSYKLHKLYVLSQIQGKGIGKAIIDFIVDDIRRSNASSLILNVNRYNKARSFYEKLGFKVIGEEDVDIGNGYFMNDYVMELNLI